MRKEAERRLDTMRISWEAERIELDGRLAQLQVQERLAQLQGQDRLAQLKVQVPAIG